MNWIDCNERIDEDKKVLIRFGEPFFGECVAEMDIGYFDSESEQWRFWFPDRPVQGYGVTHWMPLPDPQTGYTLSQQERDAIGAEYLERVAWRFYQYEEQGCEPTPRKWLLEEAAKLRGGE